MSRSMYRRCGRLIFRPALNWQRADALPSRGWHDSSKAEMENMLEPTDRKLGQPDEWMTGRYDSIRGVVLAGIYPWANSVFDRMLARPLVPVAHKPLISYALSWLAEAGISRVTVCGNPQTRALQALAPHIVSEMTYSYVEDSMPRGAAGCVRDAADGDQSDTYVVTDGAAVPNGVDLPELLERHQASGADATVVVYSEPPVRFFPQASMS